MTLALMVTVLAGLLMLVWGKQGRGDDGYCYKGDDGVEHCTQHRESLHLVRIPGHELGHVEELSDLQDGKVYSRKTLSLKPLLFEIPNFLSETECDHLVALAEDAGLKESITRIDPNAFTQNIRVLDVDQDKQLSISEMMLTIEDSFDIYFDEEDILKMYTKLKMDTNGDKLISQKELQQIKILDFRKYMKKIFKEQPVKRSRQSSQTWLFAHNSTDNTFLNIAQRVRKLTKLPKLLMEESDFQIVRYDVDGHYNAHYDSANLTAQLPCCERDEHDTCRLCRFLTVLFYLKDVEEGGGTAFPIADNKTFSAIELRTEHRINLQRHCSKANLMVRPEKGKAVMWYNHYIDETATNSLGLLDDYSVHGGCPVLQGEKWIGNFWINIPESVNDDEEDVEE